MRIHKKIITLLSAMIFVVSLVLALFMFLSINEMQSHGSKMSERLELNAEENVRRELQNLVNNISSYILSLEEEIDRSMLNAARVLYELDRLSEGSLTSEDLERIRRDTGMSDLYLGDANGVFTLSTESAALGLSLFDIWDGYRALVTGESDYIPSDLKIKAETGEIFKFTAIPRADNRGVLESALDAGAVEEYLQSFINDNKSIRFMNLFDIDLMTLTDNNAEGVSSIYTKGIYVSPGVTEIDDLFKNSAETKIFMDRQNAQVYSPVISDGRVRYVLFIELDTENYFAMQELIEESIGDLVRKSINFSIISLGTVFIILLLFTVFISIVIIRLVRRLEEAVLSAEAANKSKSVFLSTMSHEIRTPMNSIIGFAELALEVPSSGMTPKIKEYLTRIKDSTAWLLNIINDILDISKIEAGKIELEKVPFNLSDIFLRCQSVALPSAKDKGLDLWVYSEPHSGKKLLGDPVRLYQALMNLLSNAVKFTDEGIIKFSSSIKSIKNGRAVVYFEVKDSGIGMTAEQTEKIFEPFMQADSSTTRDYGGTGLGLSIVKSIVEMMGGVLMVESVFGEGSSFSFELAFDTINNDGELKSKTENTGYGRIKKPYFNGLVLICDDNSMNREVICEHLARVGLETVTAENGEEGVSAVKERIQAGKKPFDLIFMDMFMPVMDGIEAASKITQLGTDVPIIAMTANVMSGEIEKYKKHGMKECLGKPFTTKELWHTLLKYLTPVKESNVPAEKTDNAELQKKLKINFYRNNQSKLDDIIEAISKGDIKTAHRLAHTLKGNAAQIGRIGLQSVAGEIEILLKSKKIPLPEDKMNLLKIELEATLSECKGLYDENTGHKKNEPLTPEKTAELLNKLEPMLEKLNPECVNLLSEIRAVPGAEKLTKYIEEYDFISAAEALDELKAKE